LGRSSLLGVSCSTGKEYYLKLGVPYSFTTCIGTQALAGSNDLG
jgi:hypothetical protein